MPFYLSCNSKTAILKYIAGFIRKKFNPLKRTVLRKQVLIQSFRVKVFSLFYHSYSLYGTSS